jgi:hypothetical protein
VSESTLRARFPPTQTYEEGELIDPDSGISAEKKNIQEMVKTLILTQLSSVFDSTAMDLETEGEELVDYEEEPVSKEKAEMANLEKCIEERAIELLEDQAIRIPPLGDSSDNGNQNSASNKSG